MGEFGKNVEDPQGGEQRNGREITDGLTEFLEDNGFEGGVVPLTIEEEGKSVEKNIPFNELSAVQKYNIINGITESKSEGKYELNESEVDAINVLREKGKSLEEYVNDITSSEIDKVENHYLSQSKDYKNMDEDALHMMYLSEKYPDKSADELKEEHDISKELEGFDKKISAIRNNYIEKEELDLLQKEKEFIKKRDDNFEKQRSFIVNETFDTEKIAGWRVTKEDLNNVYSKILETNENGVSAFQEEVFSDPKNMVKAAYLYDNAENLFNRMETFYKNELKKAKAEASKEIINGNEGNKTRTTYISDNKDNKKNKKDNNKKDFYSFDDD